MTSPQKRRRHHYIPRFLLNRFASANHRHKFWIWQLSHTRSPKMISTRDAAVGYYFYGSDTIEERLSIAEGGFLSALRGIDHGTSPERFHSQLRAFVWYQHIRTKAIRTSFLSTVDQLVLRLFKMIENDVPSFKANVYDLIRRNFPLHITSAYRHMPLSQQIAVRLQMQDPVARARLLKVVLSTVETQDFTPILNALRKTMENVDFETSIKTGHQRAMALLLDDPETRIPDHFQPRNWKVLQPLATADKYILGDICVLARNEDGRMGPLFKFTKTWSEMYFPLSPDMLLFANSDEKSWPLLDVHDVNLLSVRSAVSHVFAHQCDAREQAYVYRLAIIQRSACKHRDFSITLIATIEGTKIRLCANEITLVATRLLSSARNQITCERGQMGRPARRMASPSSRVRSESSRPFRNLRISTGRASN